MIKKFIALITQSSIVITSSSNENAVYKDDYGRWVTTTAIGEKILNQITVFTYLPIYSVRFGSRPPQ